MSSEMLDTVSGDAAQIPRRSGVEPAAIEDLERELKFVLPAGRAAAALAWLRTICRPDPSYPSAFVWTVYYDTPSLESLDEKLNSDYLKMKVRVRWYGTIGRTASGPVFVEAKFRVGPRRQKVRAKLPVDAVAVSGLALDHQVFATFPQALVPQGVLAGHAWRPVLKLRYRRSRFIEPMTGARVSLDQDITAEAVNTRELSQLNVGPLPVAVVEVKGREQTLPRPLMPMLHLGARLSSLSKYVAVYQHVRRLF